MSVQIWYLSFLWLWSCLFLAVISKESQSLDTGIYHCAYTTSWLKNKAFRSSGQVVLCIINMWLICACVHKMCPWLSITSILFVGLNIKSENRSLKSPDILSYFFPLLLSQPVANIFFFLIWFHLHLYKLFILAYPWEGMVLKTSVTWVLMT